MISFAPANESDFERLLDLRIRVMREHLERLGRYDPERARQRFRNGFQPEHMRLIEVEGSFAGCVTLKPRGDHLEIEHFYVEPGRQGHGLGAEVIGRLFAEADAANLPIRLGVLKQSPAIRFYERHGFMRTHEDEWDVYYERAAPGGFVLTDAPDDTLQTVIDDGLAAYNLEHVGYRDSKPVATVIRDPATGKTIGGMLGRTSYGVLLVNLVFLPKEMRGHDLGSRMLAAMEAEGKRRGCRSGILFTLSFQAPGFYAKHGWREFGRVPCDPPGTFRVFMTKSFEA